MLLSYGVIRYCKVEHRILGFPNAISVRHFPGLPVNFETCSHQDDSSEGPKVGPRLVRIQNRAADVRDTVVQMVAKMLPSVKPCGVLTPDDLNFCCPLKKRLCCQRSQKDAAGQEAASKWSVRETR